MKFYYFFFVSFFFFQKIIYAQNESIIITEKNLSPTDTLRSMLTISDYELAIKRLYAILPQTTILDKREDEEFFKLVSHGYDYNDTLPVYHTKQGKIEDVLIVGMDSIYLPLNNSFAKYNYNVDTFFYYFDRELVQFDSNNKVFDVKTWYHKGLVDDWMTDWIHFYKTYEEFYTKEVHNPSMMFEVLTFKRIYIERWSYKKNGQMVKELVMVIRYGIESDMKLMEVDHFPATAWLWRKFLK